MNYQTLAVLLVCVLPIGAVILFMLYAICAVGGAADKRRGR